MTLNTSTFAPTTFRKPVAPVLLRTSAVLLCVFALGG